MVYKSGLWLWVLELHRQVRLTGAANSLVVLSAGTTKCLDLPGGNAQNGQLMQIWDCNQHENQDWIFDSGAWRIQYAADPSKCIDNLGDGAAGNKLGVWDCNGKDSQKWGFDSTSQTLFLASSSSDASLCMDLTGGDSTNGNKIQIWSCNGHSNQKWNIGYGYDPAEAQMFAALSSVTYCQDTTHVSAWTCGTCQEAKTPLVPGKIKFVDAGDFHAMRVMVAKLQDQAGCVVAFRGSDNPWNWIRDLEAWTSSPSAYPDCDGCKVHSGFYDTWEKVKNSVLGALSQVGCSSNGDNTLYITGHSLGAALTHLAMFGLSNLGYNIAKTYSFEAPRVGNVVFEQTFDARFGRKFPVFRLTHAQDPVVHLPPKALGFEHVQKEVFYAADGNYYICKGPEDKGCADQYWDVPGMIAKHSADHCNSPLVSSGSICGPSCDVASPIAHV